MLYELLLKYGLDLAVPIEERRIDGRTIYIIGAGALIVCLADKVSLDVVEGIAKLKAELKPEVMRVVFKDAGFKDDVVKTPLAASQLMMGDWMTSIAPLQGSGEEAQNSHANRG